MLKKYYHKKTNCLNCNYQFTENIIDNFCPNCGQKNSDRKYSLGELIKDGIASAFNFDFKSIKAFLGLLVFPGRLTKNFLLGKRTSNPSPFRMFLVLSFIAFFMFSYTIKQLGFNKSIFQVGFDDSGSLTEDALYCEIQNSYLNLNSDELQKNQFLHALSLTVVDDTSPSEAIKKIGISCKYYEIKCLALNEIIKILHFKHEEISSNIDEIGVKTTNYMIGNMGLTILFTLPILALFLKVVYIRRKFLLVEHLIFSINYWNAVLLAFIIFQAVVLIFNKSILPAYLLLLSSFLLFLINIKVVYKQGHFKTFLKSIAVYFTYFTIATLILVLSFTFSMYMVLRV